MNWKFTGDRPVYQQIMDTLRGAVLQGELPPGEKVPSVRELAARAQVNPNTVQRALTELSQPWRLQGGSRPSTTHFLFICLQPVIRWRMIGCARSRILREPYEEAFS